MIDCDKTWFRPDKAYFDSLSQAKGIDLMEFEWNGKYKSIRELRGLSIFGLCLYELYKIPFYVQMNERDSSPDAFVMGIASNDAAESEIGLVEITFFGRSRKGLPEESLVDRLVKKGGKIWKLPSNYCLLIHIGRDLSIDYEEVSNCLNKFKLNFQVFSIQEVATYPNTVTRIDIYRPKHTFRNINLGEVCYNLRELNMPQIVNVIRGKQPKV